MAPIGNLLPATAGLLIGWHHNMDETSREDADDQIDEDNAPSVERTGHLDSSNVLFATFVEPTMSALPGIAEKARIEPSLFHSDLIPPRCRIALMADPSNEGRYLWTFVPLAKGTGAEPTTWPHKVILLGEEILTTQETWDMYKCDPEYECYIPPAPGLPTVSKRRQPPPSKPENTRAKTPLKRMGSDAANSGDSSPRKRQKTTAQEASDDSGIEELTRSHYEATRAKLKRQQEKEERTREHARTASFRMSNMANDLPNVRQNGFGNDVDPSSKPPKEKFSMDTDPVQIKRGRQSFEDTVFLGSKRARFAQSEEDETEKEYLRRNRARRKPTVSRRVRGTAPPQNKAKERDFWQDVNFSQFKGQKFSLETDSPENNAKPNVKEEEAPHQPSVQQGSEEHEAAGDSSTRRSPPILVDSADEDSDDEKARGESDYAMPSGAAWDGWDEWEGVEDSEDERERRLYESRKKMEELNKLERLAREEKKRREREQAARMEEERRRQQQRQRAEKLRQESVEEELRRAKAEKENRRRGEPYGSWHQTNAPWSETHHTSGTHRSNGFNFEWFNSYGGNPFGSRGSTFGSYQARPARPTASSPNRWTSQNALDRYNKLSESFDAFKPTPTAAVPELGQIPWPVLFKPGFSMEQVNWEAVEQFFSEAEKLMGGRGYGREKWKEFLKTSTRRFHPDRWRARGIIGDKGYGIDVEEKVNHVSKVLTPLYRNAN